MLLWLQLGGGKSTIKLPSFGGVWRGQSGIHIPVRFGGISKHSFLGLDNSGRHSDDQVPGVDVQAARNSTSWRRLVLASMAREDANESIIEVQCNPAVWLVLVLLLVSARLDT